MKLCECKCGWGMCASSDFVRLTAAISKMRDCIEAYKAAAEAMNAWTPETNDSSYALLEAARKLYV